MTNGLIRTRFRLLALMAWAAFGATASAPGATALGQATPADDQPAPIDTTLELATFDSVWSRVQRTYYDSTMRGLDWEGVRRELRPRVARATSRAAVRSVIAEMLGRLGESHFAILPGHIMADSAPTAAPAGGSERPGVAGLEVRLLEDRLVVTRVDSAGPAARAGIRAGFFVDRIGPTEVAPSLAAARALPGENERRLAGLRLTIRFQSELAGPAGSSLVLRVRDARGQVVDRKLVRRETPGEVVQFGALPPMHTFLEQRRVDLREGCAGVIRFNMFMPNLAAPLDDAMSAFKGCQGIVLDLRGNLGGVAAMVMGVAGYFFDEQVQLGELRLRGNQLRYVANPRRVTRRGERVEPYAGPLAILVDELSASTTEIFAAALQQHSRARVFGLPSAGQALPALMMRLPNGDGLMYVIADFTAPGGRRLEGQGVVPDVRVSRTRAALLSGADETLVAALRWIESERNRPAEPAARSR
jgi:carboxyl-terminal processing protease